MDKLLSRNEIANDNKSVLKEQLHNLPPPAKVAFVQQIHYLDKWLPGYSVVRQTLRCRTLGADLMLKSCSAVALA